MKPKLLIVTGNPLKFKELTSGLNGFFDCEQRDWKESEIQGAPEEIIKHKLARAFDVYKQPVLVDDTSVHFEELNGFPGPYAKDFWKSFSPYEAGVKFAGSRMKVINYIGLCRGEGDSLIVEGTIGGKVIKPEDNNHQGKEFDLFMQVDGTDKPMIEFSTEEKNEISHRGLAIKNLIKVLEEEKK